MQPNEAIRVLKTRTHQHLRTLIEKAGEKEGDGERAGNKQWLRQRQIHSNNIELYRNGRRYGHYKTHTHTHTLPIIVYLWQRCRLLPDKVNLFCVFCSRYVFFYFVLFLSLAVVIVAFVQHVRFNCVFLRAPNADYFGRCYLLLSCKFVFKTKTANKRPMFFLCTRCNMIEVIRFAFYIAPPQFPFIHSILLPSKLFKMFQKTQRFFFSIVEKLKRWWLSAVVLLHEWSKSIKMYVKHMEMACENGKGRFKWFLSVFDCKETNYTKKWQVNNGQLVSVNHLAIKRLLNPKPRHVFTLVLFTRSRGFICIIPSHQWNKYMS